MNLPEWTGELWQWVLLAFYGGGVFLFVMLFVAALLSRPGYRPTQNKHGIERDRRGKCVAIWVKWDKQ